MTDIKNLTQVNELSAGDLVPIYTTSNGATRKASAAAFVTAISDSYVDQAEAQANAATLTVSAFQNLVYPGVYAVDPTTRPNGSAVQEGDRAVVLVGGLPTEKLRSGGLWIVPNVDAVNISASTGAGLVGFSSAISYPAGTVGKQFNDISDASGSSLVGFTQSGAGAESQELQTKIRRNLIDVKDYGAVGDGVSDDTAAINAAITAAGTKRDLLFPIPSVAYNITSALVQLTGQRWIGEGGKRQAVIKKMANMAQMVTTGDQGTLNNLTFDGNGATYTGRGIFVGPGNEVKLERIRVTQTEGISLEFADESGAGCCITDFYGDTTSPTVVPAVKLGASATNAFPKFFDGLWLSGGLLDISANNAGRDCSITNFFIRNIVTSSLSLRAYIANGRVASLLDTTTIYGAELCASNVAFSGPVVLDGAIGTRFGSGNIYHGGISEVNQASGAGNIYTSRLTPYTPVWSQASGLQPAVNDGTLQGWFTKNGDICTVTVQLTFGSTTDPGNNATGYLFSLPLRASTQINQRIIGADILDASPVAQYLPYVTISGDAQVFKLSTTQDVRATFPITWATGDIIRAQFTYYTA